MALIRCPKLVGRDRELAAVTEMLVAAAGGHGSAIAFVGEAGIGKSRLAGECVARARTMGLRVAVGRSAEESVDVPLRAWTEALMGSTRGLAWPDAPLLAPYRAILATMVPAWRAPGWSAPIEPRLVIGEAIVQLLHHLAGSTAVLLVLDDLHWADPATIDVLRYVAANLADARVAMCLLLRDEASGRELQTMLRSESIEPWRLDRLSDDRVREMLDACMDLRLGADHQTGVIARSGGLPLAVEDLAAAAHEGGGPERFSGIVQRRLASLTTEQRRVIHAAAILGERPDWRVAVAAAGLSDATGAQALAVAAEVDLLSVNGLDVRFRHALTRDVIVDGVDPLERVSLARSLASALTRYSEPSVERDLVAADLFVVGEAKERACELLERGAERAEANGELVDAVLLAERAYEWSTGPIDVDRLSLGVRLLRLRRLSGDNDGVTTLGRSLLAQADGRNQRTVCAIQLSLAWACAERANWADAEGYAREARATGLAHDDIAELAVIEGVCAFGADRPGQRAAVQHQAMKALELARRAQNPRLVSEAALLLGRAARQYDLDAAGSALEAGLHAVESLPFSVERLRLLNELGTVEMLRDGRADRLERAYDEATRVGASGAAASAGLNLASAYAMTGRHDECANLAAQVAGFASRLGLRPLEAGCLFMGGVAAAFNAERRRANRLLKRAEELAPDDADLRAGVWAIGHGLGALIDNDRSGALRAFERAQTLAPHQHGRILDASVGPQLLLRATEGSVNSATVDLAVDAQVLGARWPLLWLGVAGATALAHEGDLTGAEVRLTDALEAGDCFPLFSAIARDVATDTAISTGFTEPAVLLRDAESRFDQLGLSRAADRMRARLRALGEHAPRLRGDVPDIDPDLRRAGITAREAEVLGLVGERRSNKEIAEMLFLSPKTVEKHVASLSAKLHTSSRRELGEIGRLRLGR